MFATESRLAALSKIGIGCSFDHEFAIRLIANILLDDGHALPPSLRKVATGNEEFDHEEAIRLLARILLGDDRRSQTVKHMLEAEPEPGQLSLLQEIDRSIAQRIMGEEQAP